MQKHRYAMEEFVGTVPSVQLVDELLSDIAHSLQLTETQNRNVETAYRSIGEWLSDDESPLRNRTPDIFPQGSLRIHTTVRPLKTNQYDLDIVCCLKDDGKSPKDNYKDVLDRLSNHGTYEKMIEPMDRCIRLNYSADYHLDVVVAVSAPQNGFIKVADVGNSSWRTGNPRGYAQWFEKRVELTKVARMAANEAMEPLKSPIPFDQKETLRIVVQLLKRWRDVAFKERMEQAPSSIILTTLAGKFYDGERNPTFAFRNIVNYIHSDSLHGAISLKNPANPTESITEKWDANPRLADPFLKEIAELRSLWENLDDLPKIDEVTTVLKRIFEEKPVNSAFAKFAERRNSARESGELLMERRTGNLQIGPVSAGAAVVPKNTFFGGK